jgi:hypothetical protein
MDTVFPMLKTAVTTHMNYKKAGSKHDLPDTNISNDPNVIHVALESICRCPLVKSGIRLDSPAGEVFGK